MLNFIVHYICFLSEWCSVKIKILGLVQRACDALNHTSQTVCYERLRVCRVSVTQLYFRLDSVISTSSSPRDEEVISYLRWCSICLDWKSANFLTLSSIQAHALKNNFTCLIFAEDRTKQASSLMSWIWFVGRGISLTPHCFIYNGVLSHIITPLSKNCSSSDVDITPGYITISVIFWSIVQLYQTQKDRSMLYQEGWSKELRFTKNLGFTKWQLCDKEEGFFSKLLELSNTALCI